MRRLQDIFVTTMKLYVIKSFSGDYSWMVALGYQEKNNNEIVFRCGGCLIATGWVLTAAQCVTGLGNSEL